MPASYLWPGTPPSPFLEPGMLGQGNIQIPWDVIAFRPGDTLQLSCTDRPLPPDFRVRATEYWSPGIVPGLLELKAMNGYTLYDYVAVMIPSDGVSDPEVLEVGCCTSKSPDEAQANMAVSLADEVAAYREDDPTAGLRVFVRPFVR